MSTAATAGTSKRFQEVPDERDKKKKEYLATGTRAHHLNDFLPDEERQKFEKTASAEPQHQVSGGWQSIADDTASQKSPGSMTVTSGTKCCRRWAGKKVCAAVARMRLTLCRGGIRR